MTQDKKGANIIQKAIKGNKLTKREYERFQAVLLKKKGYSLKQIIDITGKSLSAIQGWISSYNKYGVKRLKDIEQIKEPNAKLKRSQKDQIKQLITGHKPTEYDISDDFWSVPAIQQLVWTRFRVKYKNVKSYRELLKYSGYSYQKVEYVDIKRKNEDEEKFKKRFTGRLKKGGFSMWW